MGQNRQKIKTLSKYLAFASTPIKKKWEIEELNNFMLGLSKCKITFVYIEIGKLFLLIAQNRTFLKTSENSFSKEYISSIKCQRLEVKDCGNERICCSYQVI